MSEIKICLSDSLKEKPKDETKLGFGDIFTDHMFMMDYDPQNGWHDPRIVPYGPISLSPAAMCLHYGQEVFEGMKAYRTKDGIQLFRPDENFKRLNVSNDRLCIPLIDEKVAYEGLKKLIEVDQDWVPHSEGTSLYIRPFIIATDEHLGVCPGHHYYFIIILSPVGAYYEEGLNPVNIYVETKYVRTVRGGMGMAKTGGNYAASIKAQDEAAVKYNYTQVLWLDGVERRYIEEVGTMNVFFKIGDTVVTPALEGSVLSGITRKSCIDILRSWGIKVEERRLSIDEVERAFEEGTLVEAFGTGTAAVISPIGHLKYHDKVMEINGGKIGELSQKLYDELTGIQWGKREDRFGWVDRIITKA